jgi:hypothetical protein
MAITNETSTGIGAGSGTVYSDPAAGGARSGAQGFKAEVKDKAGELAGRARDRAASGIEDTLVRAAGEMHTVASALRQCGTDLNTGRDGVLTPYVEQVADQVDRLSGFLEKRSVDDLTRDVQSFARRNPAVFLGACFGLGVLAARFLKSSRPQLPVPYDAGPDGDNYSANLDRTEPREAAYTEPVTEPTYVPSRGGAAYSGPLRGTTGGIGNDYGAGNH